VDTFEDLRRFETQSKDVSNEHEEGIKC